MNLSPEPQSSSVVISRRTALNLIAFSVVAGLVGYSRFSKPKPAIFNPDILTLPRHLTETKTVVVIGAGLAGLASAYELSQRGFKVTLLEKSPQLGGKIASWPIEVGTETFRMEHGFHGFFPQYYNLKSLVSELQIEDQFLSLEFYSVVFKDQKYQPEVFRPSHSSFPWNVVDLTISSTNRWHWGINLTKPHHWEVFQAISGFNPEKTFAKFDQISVADWVKSDFPQGLYDLYFLPFAKSSLNAPDRLSTAELLQFFHFYFFGNPEGLAFNGTRQDMGSSLVQPIVKQIQENGGEVLTDVIVSKIQEKEGKLVSVSYHEKGETSDVPFWVKQNALLTETYRQSDGKGYEYFGAGDEVFAVLENQKEAISLTCPHQGCTVHPTGDRQFQCPCHGATFDQNGRVIKGPATRNLSQLKVLEKQAEQVQLVAKTTGKNSETVIPADYVVFATDVPGTQHLFTLIQGEIPVSLVDQIEALSVADPFAVCRFWFDQDFDWEHSDFTSLSGYRLTDSITLYHHIQDQFKEWHQKTGGSVVELHAYCYKETEFPTQQDLLTTFEAELYEIVPQLQSATLLHRELVNQKNFAGYPPGSYEKRPETESEISNLIFAGDWVKMPFPCGLMERAVSSGLLAANTILVREGRQQRMLLSVQPDGILKGLT